MISSSRNLNGNITSPGYGDNSTYDNSEQCIWVISSLNNANSSIALQFSDIHIESHVECVWDYVEIREGEIYIIKLYETRH